MIDWGFPIQNRFSFHYSNVVLTAPIHPALVASNSSLQVSSPNLFPLHYAYEHFSIFWTTGTKNFYSWARHSTWHVPLLHLILLPTSPHHLSPAAPQQHGVCCPKTCAAFSKVLTQALSVHPAAFQKGFSLSPVALHPPHCCYSDPMPITGPGQFSVQTRGKQQSSFQDAFQPRAAVVFRLEHLNSKLSNWTHIRIAADSVTK